MKRKLYSIPLFISLICVFFLSGYTYPDDNVYYIKGSGTLGNNVTVYIPYNPNYRFAVSSDSVVNVYSSTASGYFGDYTISFPTFGDPYYYPNGAGRVYISWSEITDYRLPNIESPSNYLGEVILVVGVLIFAVLVFKR